MSDKARQRYDVLVGFGRLMAPASNLAAAATPPAVDAYRAARAKIDSGDPLWREMVRSLVTFAPDVVMTAEFTATSHTAERFVHKLKTLISLAEKTGDLKKVHTDFQSELRNTHNDLHDCLSKIPPEWEHELFDANTPFTVHCAIRDAAVTATKAIHYFDRYLNADFFELYLRDAARDIEIRLVTTTGNGPLTNNPYGVLGVSAVSAIARVQFTDYQLIEVDYRKIHDRILVIDDQLFSLPRGTREPSGSPPTSFGPLPSDPADHSIHNTIIAAGTVIHKS